MLAPENATMREKRRKLATAVKTIRRNILFVNTFSGGEVESDLCSALAENASVSNAAD